MKKYDRRSITSAENGRRAWAKHLETQIVALANSTKDDRIRLDAFKYLWDRAEGKPHIATNPAERNGRPVVVDQRLQLAIQQLILGPQAASQAPAAAKQPEPARPELRGC